MTRANTATAVAIPEAKDVITQVDDLLEKRRGQFLDLLAGDPAVVDRLRTLTLHALAQPKLLEKLRKSDPMTVLEAVRECAALGLMPIPALAEGYFVPYWNGGKGKFDIQFQAGYQGLAKLIRNSGRVLDVDANVAYEGDEFDYDEGSAAFIRHKRALSNRGNRIAAYAIAWLPGGLTKVRVLDIATVEQHRRASKAADDGPWVEWYDAMAAKTALTQLGKFLPKSPQVERALILDAEAEETHQAPPSRQRPSRLISSIHERLGVPASVDDTQDVNQADKPADPVPGDSGSDPATEARDEGDISPEEAAELDGLL